MRNGSLFVASAFLAVAHAQSYVVDVNNGPGTNYTSIAAAVAAVPDGATLLVRPGDYGSFAIAGKGLTILGSGTVRVMGAAGSSAITVQSTNPTQRVVLAGLASLAAGTFLSADNCLGPLLLEELSAGYAFPYPAAEAPPAVSLGQCHQVMLRDVVSAEGHLYSEAQDLALERCAFTGVSAQVYVFTITRPAKPGLILAAGTATIAASALTGGEGSWIWAVGPVPAGPGISLSASARVMGSSQIRAGAGYSTVPAVSGAGVLRLDPATVVQPAGLPASLIVTVAPQPEVAGTSAPIGGTLSATAVAQGGQFVVLVHGLPWFPYAVAGIADPFWIDPLFFAVAGFGTTTVTSTIAVPPAAGLRGITIAWQAVVSSGGELIASNPSWTLVQ